MLAARLPTIVPSFAPEELLEISMIPLVAGKIEGALPAIPRPAPLRQQAGAPCRRVALARRGSPLVEPCFSSMNCRSPMELCSCAARRGRFSFCSGSDI